MEKSQPNIPALQRAGIILEISKKYMSAEGIVDYSIDEALDEAIEKAIAAYVELNASQPQSHGLAFPINEPFVLDFRKVCIESVDFDKNHRIRTQKGQLQQQYHKFVFVINDQYEYLF